jgi:hypothetical protein
MFDSFFRPRILGRLLVLVTALTIYGCGPAAKPQGKITGSVKYKGKPVTAGLVTLMGKGTGSGTTAILNSSGEFTVPTMDAGTYTIAIGPPTPKQLPPGTKAEAAQPFTIPIKYQDPGQSTITKDVDEGDNVMDIEVPE